MATADKKLISVILPAFNEEENLPALYANLRTAADEMAVYDFEFIFVDDCSRDATPDIVRDLCRNDRRAHTIRFSRNCGSHAADAAGLYHCRGDAAVIMPVDLQEMPTVVLPALCRGWEGGHAIVWGIRDKREEGNPLTVLLSRAFYRLIRMLSGSVQPPSDVGAILLDRIAIDAFKKVPEKNSSIIMLIAWLGFSQERVTYPSGQRHAGRSKWTIAKRIKLSFDSIVSFSYAPMRFMSLFGVICTGLGVAYSAYIFGHKLMHNVSVEGWSSLMIAVLLIGGVQTTMLGILGEYLWRAYDEARRRPMYIIEKNTLPERER